MGISDKDRRMLLFLSKIKGMLNSYKAPEYILYKTAYNLFSATDEYEHRNPNSAQSQLLLEFNYSQKGKKCEPMTNFTYANIKLALFEIEDYPRPLCVSKCPGPERGR